MVARWIIIAGLGVVLILLVGVNIAWNYAFVFAPVTAGDDDGIVAFRADVEHAYETEGVDFMEQMGNRLRGDESRVTGGTTKLYEFYNVLDDIGCWCRTGDRKTHSFEDRQRRLQEWLDKYPHSVTATFAMALLWEYRAWQEVGGYGSQEMLGGPKLSAFNDAIAKSRSYLEHLKIEDDPYVAFLWMRMQLDQGPARDEMDRLFAASTAAWPRHYPIYYLYANLLEQELGDRQARIDLMRRLAAAKQDTDKQVALSFILGSSFGWWSPADLPYTDVVDSYMMRDRVYGWRWRDWNVMCRIAVRAGDWVGAKYCFRMIKGHWDDQTWQNQYEFVWNELVALLHY